MQRNNKTVDYSLKGATYLSQCLYTTMNYYLERNNIQGSISMQGYEDFVHIKFTNGICSAETDIAYDSLFEANKDRTIAKKSLQVIERLIMDAEIKRGRLK